jgi:hypothetical protein
MFMNEDVHKMRAQILNLRAAMMTISTALCRFPACGTPMGCHLRCPTDRKVMRQIDKDMRDLVISARMVLSALFSHQSQVWDFYWFCAKDESCPERSLSQMGKDVISDQDEYIRYYGEIDDEMFDALASGFNERERDILFAEDAWQNGHRLSQILHLAGYLETQMEKKFDALVSMVRNCEVGKKAGPRLSATA